MPLPVFDRSPLDKVSPHGRIDVLVSNLASKVATDARLDEQYRAIRPLTDLALVYLFGPPGEFERAVRKLSKPVRQPRPVKKQARKRIRAAKVRINPVSDGRVYDAEFVDV